MCKQLWELVLATGVRDDDSHYRYRRSEVAMFSRTMPQALNHRRHHGADDAPSHDDASRRLHTRIRTRIHTHKYLAADHRLQVALDR
jgi:hypothetical protein